MDIVIRPVIEQEIYAVCLLRQHISLQTYSSFDRKEVFDWVLDRHSLSTCLEEFEQGFMLGCFINDMLVGTGYCQLKDSNRLDNTYQNGAYLGGLYLDAGIRKQGIGSQLILQRLNWLKEQKVKRVLTEVEPLNIHADHVVRKHGFEYQNTDDFSHRVQGMKWNVYIKDL